MKDTDKNFSDDAMSDDIFDDVSDIDEIDEEYYAEFGDDELADDYDDRLEKVLDELAELKSNMSTGAPAAKPLTAYSPAQQSSNPNEAALYNEISRLRDELSKTQNTQAIQQELNKLRDEFNRNDRGDDALRAEVLSLKAQLRKMKQGDLDDLDYGVSTAGSDIRKLYSEITASLSDSEQRIIESVDAVSKRLDGEIKFAENEDIADVFQALKDLRADISKISVSVDESGETIITSSSPDEVNLFLSEIVSLRDELQEYKDNVSTLIDKVSGTVSASGSAIEDDESISGSSDNVTIMLDELTSIRTEISNYADELDALKTGVADIKNIVRAGVVSGGGDGSSSLETALLLSEINEIKSKVGDAGSADIKAVGDELRALSTARGEEIEALKEEVRNLSEQLSKRPAHSSIVSVEESSLPADVKETLSVIFDEIRAIREEPDYSVMNEILALREEFQAMKEQVAKNTDAHIQPVAVAAVSTFDHEGAYNQTVEEIRSLREQLFAISMAKVANGKKDPEYENYNNILLDEIASLREELEKYTKEESAQISSITAVIADSKSDGKEFEKLQSDIAALSDKIEGIDKGGDYDKLAGDIESLKSGIADVAGAVEESGKKETVVNVPPVEGIDDIKAELATQKEVNKTMIGMLSDILHAIDLLRSQAIVSAKPADDNSTAVIAEIDKLADMIKELEKSEPVQPVVEVIQDNKEVEEAISKLRDELAMLSGLNEAKAKEELAATKEPKEKKPAAKKAPAKKTEEKKAEEKKPAAKKPAAKKPAAKKPAAKKAPAKKPAAKKEAKPKAPEKVADKQALDEYVATLDKGDAEDISKMLKDILNYEDTDKNNE